MKKQAVKTYDFVLQNLRMEPLALSRSIVPAGATGKVALKTLDQVRLTHQLEQNGLISVVSGWTNELRQTLGLAGSVNAATAPIAVTATVKAVVAPVAIENAPETAEEAPAEIVPSEPAEQLSIEQIEAMTKEDMMDFARKVGNLDIGKRTPFDVAQIRMKTYFGYSID